MLVCVFLFNACETAPGPTETPPVFNPAGKWSWKIRMVKSSSGESFPVASVETQYTGAVDFTAPASIAQLNATFDFKPSAEVGTQTLTYDAPKHAVTFVEDIPLTVPLNTKNDGLVIAASYDDVTFNGTTCRQSHELRWEFDFNAAGSEYSFKNVDQRSFKDLPAESGKASCGVFFQKIKAQFEFCEKNPDELGCNPVEPSKEEVYWKTHFQSGAFRKADFHKLSKIRVYYTIDAKRD